ncbi:MAG: HAD-IIIA family hydrolase [Thermodesulfovibrionaceae bacterium]
MERYGSVILVGEKGESINFTHEAVVDLTGKTSLSELISIISECDLLLCNDSGVMHIGYATGTPLVAIFGSTSPDLTGPPKGTGRVVKSTVNCSPCFKRSCSDIKCMKTIDVDEVWNALEDILPKSKAIFFDRDGTLCKDVNYLSNWKNFEVYPEVEQLKRLKDLGFLLIGVTNQSGIARGLIREDFVNEVNRYFIEKYGFDDFFYCPHHPDEGCFCRKPNPAMAILARYKYKIDFKQSFVVGDKETDLKMAEMIGAKGVQIGKDARNLKEVIEIIERSVNA